MENRSKMKIWLRWTYAIFLGILFKFLLDIIFSLIYAKYALIQPFTHYLVSIFATYIVLETMFLLNKSLNKKIQWENHIFKRFSIQFIQNGLLTVFIVIVLRWSLNITLNSNFYISFFDESIIVAYLLFLVLVFVTIDLSIFLLNKWRFSLAELERFKKENAEIRFEALQSQLNPHFLFNSLNTLSSLIYENKENASLFIRELSDVYRYILENRQKDLINLKSEIEFSNSYTNLLKLRFEDNLKVKMSMIENLENFKVAPLTLQLLIENAVKHNIISKKRPLQIQIITDENTLTVKNNLQPKQTKDYSSELGLKNIKSRYEFLTKQSIEIIKSNDEFIVKIPLIK